MNSSSAVGTYLHSWLVLLCHHLPDTLVLAKSLRSSLCINKPTLGLISLQTVTLPKYPETDFSCLWVAPFQNWIHQGKYMRRAQCFLNACWAGCHLHSPHF